MDTVKLENKRNIKIIAHRGVSGLVRENTCAAFAAAGIRSYYGIETDVRVTKDGKYVLFHDDDLKRLFGIEKRACECTFDELRALRFSGADEKTQREDLMIPTLSEYLSICKTYDKQAILELKTPLTQAQTCEIIGIVERQDCLERTTFISFARDVLLWIRQAYPTVQAQYLSAAVTEEDVQFLLDHALDADFVWKRLTCELVDRIHAAGRAVNCWTVDDLPTAESLIDMGVDFITTNILE